MPEAAPASPHHDDESTEGVSEQPAIFEVKDRELRQRFAQLSKEAAEHPLATELSAAASELADSKASILRSLLQLVVKNGGTELMERVLRREIPRFHLVDDPHFGGNARFESDDNTISLAADTDMNRPGYNSRMTIAHELVHALLEVHYPGHTGLDLLFEGVTELIARKVAPGPDNRFYGREVILADQLWQISPRYLLEWFSSGDDEVYRERLIQTLRSRAHPGTDPTQIAIFVDKILGYSQSSTRIRLDELKASMQPGGIDNSDVKLDALYFEIMADLDRILNGERSPSDDRPPPGIQEFSEALAPPPRTDLPWN